MNNIFPNSDDIRVDGIEFTSKHFCSMTFTKNGMYWTANDSLKSCIQFTQNNLIESMESVPNWPFDLVLVRNVLIYFHPDTKREILAKLRPLITDDGLLLMGESETLLGLEDHFSISNITPALCIPK